MLQVTNQKRQPCLHPSVYIDMWGQAQSKVIPEQLSTLKLHLSSSIFTWGSIRVHFLIIMYPPVSIVQVWNIFFCTRDLVLALGSVVVNAVNQLGMP